MADKTNIKGISVSEHATGDREHTLPRTPGGDDDDAEAPTVPDAEDMAAATLDSDDDE